MRMSTELIPRVRLGLVADIPQGEGRSYHVDARNIAVFRTRDGRLFATQAKCPHRQGPLADGLVGTDSVVCPLHEKRFDLASGCELGSGDCSLAVYKVHVDANEIWVELS
jgi:nitrite reductase (NADH) small subunit